MNGSVERLGIRQAMQNVFDHMAILAYVIDGQFYVIMQYEDPADVHQIQQEAVRHIESIHHVGEWRCTCTAKTTLSYVNEENAGVFRYEQMMYQFMQELGKADGEMEPEADKRLTGPESE